MELRVVQCLKASPLDIYPVSAEKGTYQKRGAWVYCKLLYRRANKPLNLQIRLGLPACSDTTPAVSGPVMVSQTLVHAGCSTCSIPFCFNVARRPASIGCSSRYCTTDDGWHSSSARLLVTSEGALQNTNNLLLQPWARTRRSVVPATAAPWQRARATASGPPETVELSS